MSNKTRYEPGDLGEPEPTRNDLGSEGVLPGQPSKDRALRWLPGPKDLRPWVKRIGEKTGARSSEITILLQELKAVGGAADLHRSTVLRWFTGENEPSGNEPSGDGSAPKRNHRKEILDVLVKHADCAPFDLPRDRAAFEDLLFGEAPPVVQSSGRPPRKVFTRVDGATVPRRAVVALGGDSGCGKTRSALEVAGPEAIHVGCSPLDRWLPFASIGRLLEALLTELGENDHQLLAKLRIPADERPAGGDIPYVRQNWRDVSPARARRNATALEEFCRLLLGQLLELLEDARRCVILDDVQNADDNSAKVLHDYQREVNGRRSSTVLILVGQIGNRLIPDNAPAMRPMPSNPKQLPKFLVDETLRAAGLEQRAHSLAKIVNGRVECLELLLQLEHSGRRVNSADDSFAKALDRLLEPDEKVLLVALELLTQPVARSFLRGLPSDWAPTDETLERCEALGLVTVDRKDFIHLRHRFAASVIAEQAQDQDKFARALADHLTRELKAYDQRSPLRAFDRSFCHRLGAHLYLHAKHRDGALAAFDDARRLARENSNHVEMKAYVEQACCELELHQPWSGIPSAPAFEIIKEQVTIATNHLEYDDAARWMEVLGAVSGGEREVEVARIEAYVKNRRGPATEAIKAIVHALGLLTSEADQTASMRAAGRLIIAFIPGNGPVRRLDEVARATMAKAAQSGHVHTQGGKRSTVGVLASLAKEAGLAASKLGELLSAEDLHEIAKILIENQPRLMASSPAENYQRELASILTQWGWVKWRSGDHQCSTRLHHEAIQLAWKLGDSRLAAWAMVGDAHTLIECGPKYDAALAARIEAIGVECQRFGDNLLKYNYLYLLGCLAQRRLLWGILKLPGGPTVIEFLRGGPGMALDRSLIELRDLACQRFQEALDLVHGPLARDGQRPMEDRCTHEGLYARYRLIETRLYSEPCGDTSTLEQTTQLIEACQQAFARREEGIAMRLRGLAFARCGSISSAQRNLVQAHEHLCGIGDLVEAERAAFYGMIIGSVHRHDLLERLADFLSLFKAEQAFDLQIIQTALER